MLPVFRSLEVELQQGVPYGLRDSPRKVGAGDYRSAGERVGNVNRSESLIPIPSSCQISHRPRVETEDILNLVEIGE